jgi:aminomethyltransferase
MHTGRVAQQEVLVSVGTPFHPRTAPLNRKMQWREWSGYFTSSAYADAHDIEYNAIREAAALIDVSPLYKYRLTGRDATRLVDRVITRDATRIQVGQVVYTPWCDEHGKVIDDGTVHRVAESEYRWTAADPQYRWLALNAAGLDVSIEDVSESVAALALQGPFSRAVLEAATGESFADFGYFRRRASSIRVGRRKVAIDVSRTGYTGDLGYELWIPADDAPAAWDALMAAGDAWAIRPAGMLALDVARLEAGLILLEVDYVSARHAMNPEQHYSPFELGLGRLVSFDKEDYVGCRALRAEQARGGPARRLVGLVLDWYDIEGLYDAQGLPPAISPSVDRADVPVFDAAGRQVGRATSRGWSPILKQAIALASVPPALERPGTRLGVEWTVEGRRGRVAAVVTGLPFLDLERKRSTPAAAAGALPPQGSVAAGAGSPAKRPAGTATGSPATAKRPAGTATGSPATAKRPAPKRPTRTTPGSAQGSAQADVGADAGAASRTPGPAGRPVRAPRPAPSRRAPSPGTGAPRPRRPKRDA